MQRISRRTVVISASGVLLAACSGGQREVPATKAGGDTGRAPAAPPTVVLASTATVSPRPTAPPPTATAKPQPSPTPQPKPLELLEKGFGQNERAASFAFVLKNPNERMAFQRIAYQVAAYDADDTVLEASSNSVTLLLPGETLGIAGDLSLPDKTVIKRLDVQFKPGQVQSAEPRPPFTFDKVTYRPDRFFSKVTGVIKSPYEQDFKNVAIYVIFYDSDNSIIGGTFNYLEFIPAQGQAAFDISVRAVGGPIAKMQPYAAFTSLSGI